VLAVDILLSSSSVAIKPTLAGTAHDFFLGEVLTGFVCPLFLDIVDVPNFIKYEKKNHNEAPLSSLQNVGWKRNRSRPETAR